MKRVSDAGAGLNYERGLFDGAGRQVGMWTAGAAGLVCPAAYERRSGFAEAAERSQARGWPVFLRPSGGGVVPQGPGIDNLALAFDAPDGTTIEDAYRWLTDILQRGISVEMAPGDTPGSFCDGTWNLSAGGRKIVGTAQRWRPRKPGGLRILAHAVILTRDTFHDGAEAVSRFHEDLGLGPVSVEVHTSLEAAFGLTVLPVDNLRRAAEETLATDT